MAPLDNPHQEDLAWVSVMVQVRVRGVLGRVDLAWVSLMVQVRIRGALSLGGSSCNGSGPSQGNSLAGRI